MLLPAAPGPARGHISIRPSRVSALLRGPWSITEDGLLAHRAQVESGLVDSRAVIAAMAPRIRARDAKRAAGRRLMAGDRSAAPFAIWSEEDEEFERDDDPHIVGQETEPRERSGIGILPIRGVLMSKADLCWEGYDSLTASGWALVDMGVADIVMPIGSPGGACQGLAEFCAAIRAWRDEGVGVYAVADFEVCSAAYAIAAQADSFYVNDSSIVGHAGTWSDWWDLTGMLAQKGVRHGYIEAPANGVKTFFADDNTEIGQAEQDAKRDKVMRPVVDHFFARFMADIEAGRGDRLDAKQAAALMAMVYPGNSPSGDGKTAIEAGIADGIATLDSLMAALIEGKAPAQEVA